MIRRIIGGKAWQLSQSCQYLEFSQRGLTLELVATSSIAIRAIRTFPPRTKFCKVIYFIISNIVKGSYTSIEYKVKRSEAVQCADCKEGILIFLPAESSVVLTDTCLPRGKGLSFARPQGTSANQRASYETSSNILIILDHI